MSYMLNVPKKIYFKTGSAPVALRELREVYHCSRALLMTDPKLYRSGAAGRIVDLLRRQEIRVAEYFTIGAQTSFADLRGALPKLQEFQPDVILGMGGENAMSAAKAMMALYADPELDLQQAAADPALIRPCTKARLVLAASDFASGAQNSPVAVLKDDAGALCVLKSLHLLPEISITDADLAAALTPEDIRDCVRAAFSKAVWLYLAPAGGEFTGGLLTDAIAALLTCTQKAVEGCPVALERLHNAGAVVGAVCGDNMETIAPDLPLFSAQCSLSDEQNARLETLAKELGLSGCEPLVTFCETL